MSNGDDRLPEQERILDSSHELISSERVEGTPVYGADGKKIGTVRSVMIHKVSGQVAYAVLVFGGGFLHRGEYVHTLPWDQLTYDMQRHGYVVELTREQIEAEPKIRLADTDRLVKRDPPRAFI